MNSHHLCRRAHRDSSHSILNLPSQICFIHSPLHEHSSCSSLNTTKPFPDGWCPVWNVPAFSFLVTFFHLHFSSSPSNFLKIIPNPHWPSSELLQCGVFLLHLVTVCCIVFLFILWFIIMCDRALVWGITDFSFSSSNLCRSNMCLFVNGKQYKHTYTIKSKIPPPYSHFVHSHTLRVTNED